MFQVHASESRWLYEVLALANNSSARLNTILRFALEKALSLTDSDIGGLILFDRIGKAPLVVTSGLPANMAEPSSSLLNAWPDKPSSPLAASLNPDLTYRVDDYWLDSASLPLFSGGRSSLQVPLVDLRRVVGVVHVESSRSQHYGDVHLQMLKALARHIPVAIGRQWLKEAAVKSGRGLDVVGVSPAFLELERQIKLAASYDAGPVIITGERGSGKELTAWALHCWSARRKGPFVPVLASTFADGLFADELFGHERYAFTGAATDRLGKFRAAAGGTIFLDEVADMPMAVQNSLLRIVETGELSQLGRDIPLRVDVRLVAATNGNLPELISQGRFRHDLYDRLRIFEIRVPPLRERVEDIIPLASHFVRDYCAKTQRHLIIENQRLCARCEVTNCAACVAPAVYSTLEQSDWPGNVRELKNLVVRLLARNPDQVLEEEHLSEEFQRQPGAASRPELLDLTLERAIRRHIERVLRLTRNNQSEAARSLGVPLSTLRSKMKKLRISMK